MIEAGMSRRRFVGWASGAGLLLVVEQHPLTQLLQELAPARAGAQTVNATLRLVRPAGQTDVTIELLDATISGNQIIPSGPGAALRFGFGSQHTAEHALTGANPTPATTTLSHVIAGPTIVVTPVSSAIPLTVEAVLDAAAAALSVQLNAATPNGTRTALELPQGVALSPAADARLNAPVQALALDDVTELWVAKLVRNGGGALGLRAVANLSATDLVTPRIPDTGHRDQLVENTVSGASPVLARADRLWLSSHGAFANLRGSWPGAPLELWVQRVVTGRDIHVETVELGYLAPFGHRAALVTIAERRFLTDTGDGVTSAMVQETYLELRQPVVTYPGLGQPQTGRKWPFTSISADLANDAPVTLVPVQEAGTDIPGVYRVQVGGSTIRVEYTATDRAGNPPVAFSQQAWFVEDLQAHNPANNQPAARLTRTFNAGSQGSLDLAGAPVAFADEIAAGGGATTKATQDFTFELVSPVGTNTAALDSADRPAYYPVMTGAEIADPALTGLGAGPNPTVSVTLHPRWLNNGNAAANFDLAFLRLATPATGELAAGSPARSVAGVDMTAELFNQTSGTGLDHANANAEWDPAEALGETSSVLGNILLSAILRSVDVSTAVPGIDIPGVEVTTDGDEITVVFSFHPPLKDNADIDPASGFVTNPDSTAEITVTSVISLDGGEPSTTTEIVLSDFGLVIPPLVGIVELDFAEIRVVQRSGEPIQVTPEMDDWRFTGDFSWLGPVANFLAKIGDGVSVEVTPTKLEVGVGITMPNVTMGVVTIRNTSASVGLVMPFDGGGTTVTAALGSKAQPITVSVMGYEGAFYLEVVIGAGDAPSSITAYVKISAQLFGLDLIVVKAGVELRLTATYHSVDGDVTFTGTVAIVGVIDVLGLVSVSVGLVATVRYESAPELIVLTGKITFRVDTFLGGGGGSIPIGRTTFELGNGPNRSGSRVAGSIPSFGDRFSETDWKDEYTQAFA